MGTQRSFFDDEFEADLNLKARARHSDPETSHLGAENITPKLNGLDAEFVARLRKLGPMTAQEVAQGNESLRKRSTYVVRRGLATVIGTRICSRTGNKASVFAIRKG